MAAWNEFDREAVEAGVLIANEPLELPGDRQDSSHRQTASHTVTDGPFAETKEQLGGFCLLESRTSTRRSSWAKKVPMRPDSSIEVQRGQGPVAIRLRELDGGPGEAATVAEAAGA